MAGTAEILRQAGTLSRRPYLVKKPDSQSGLNFSRRIPELDGLRGVAIGMVVFVHYFWFAIASRPPAMLGYVRVMTRPFWSAVDLFFILSGLLIGGNLLDARDSPNYFSTFYIRRFCRVLPIYFGFLAIVALAYRFVYQPVGAPLDWLFGGRQPWYSYLTFTQYMGLTKFTAPGAPILLITWAFAVEVQFYLVVPAIIRFVRRSALPYVFIAGIVIAPIVRLFIVFHFGKNLWATYTLLPSRMDSLFVGLLCAYCARQPAVWNWLVTRRNSVWVLFVALLAGLPALATEGIPFTLLWTTVGYAWMAALYVSAMFLALSASDSWLGLVLRWRWLTGLGTISYFVYLFHYGIYGLFMWRFTGHESILPNWTNFGITLLALEVVLVLGKLSWEYFEKPIVKWGHNWKY